MNSQERRLARVAPADRVLLLSHCLRVTAACNARYSKQGLECADCEVDCVINRLRKVAARLGYKGVCVAPGGRLALRYVEETRPKGIVAVACDKELGEGVEGVRKLGAAQRFAPPIVVVPLTRDGCVDTEVDEGKVLEAMCLGCPQAMAAGMAR